MDKLFEHNPGLPSRFPSRFEFEDYSDDELLQIFLGMLKREDTEQYASYSKETPKSKPTSLYLSYGGYMQKSDEIDEWGNTWRWNQSQYTFEDDFENITGYGSANLGTSTNPLVSRKTNTKWIYDRQRKVWCDDAGRKESSIYPGKPPPILSGKNLEPFVLSDIKWARIAIKRIGRQRGRVGFGNARAVRILFDQAKKRQGERITSMRKKGFQPNIMELVRDDLLGPFACMDALKRSDAWKELQQMEGLQEVKVEVEKLLQLVIQNAELENDEKNMRYVALNRIFLGYNFLFFKNLII